MEPLEPPPEAAPDALAQAEIDAAVSVAQRIEANIRRAVKVRSEVLEHVAVSLLAEGHVLVEDYPGVGKTALARSLARSIDCQFARVQCTADLLPADIVGTNVYNQREVRFEFRPGPIFGNVVLVDEINRAMPKTQSALLEAMAERQVTVDGTTRELPKPFLLLATENPIEHEGTFPLPEAQLDRFFLKTGLGYPHGDDELQILRDQRDGHPLGRLGPVLTLEDVSALQDAVREVYIDDLLQRWVVDLVRATRDLDAVAIGASVRGSLALERAVRAWALIQGRDYAVPDDVHDLFLPVIGHRVVFTPAFLVEARKLGWAKTMEELERRCLEIAPRPEVTPEAEVLPISEA